MWFLVALIIFSRLTLFCIHGWGSKCRCWGAVACLERDWGCRAPQGWAGRTSPDSSRQDRLCGEGDGQAWMGHQPWETPGARGRAGYSCGTTGDRIPWMGRTGWGRAREDGKAGGYSQGPDSTKACFLQTKRKLFRSMIVDCCLCLKVFKSMCCLLSLEQIFLGGTPAKRRQGWRSQLPKGWCSAECRRWAFTNIPFQRWETLSGDDWLRSEFGKTLLKTDKEPQCTLENMPLQDKEWWGRQNFFETRLSVQWVHFYHFVIQLTNDWYLFCYALFI